MPALNFPSGMGFSCQWSKFSKNRYLRLLPFFTFALETAVRRCSVKKVFLKISQISEEKTCTRVSFLINLQACNSTEKEILVQVFPCEFCEAFKNIYFVEELQMISLFFVKYFVQDSSFLFLPCLKGCFTPLIYQNPETYSY